MRSPSEPCVWCRHWGAGITKLSEIPNFYRKLSQSPGSFLSILASDGLLFGKWRWRLDVWTQSQYPFHRAQGVICVLETQSSPQDLQRNKSNAFLISLENHPKGTEGAKGWCWCAVTLPENFTEGRMRSLLTRSLHRTLIGWLWIMVVHSPGDIGNRLLCSQEKPFSANTSIWS